LPIPRATHQDVVVRLLATDLDGTLLGHGGSLSERNIQALRAAHEAGVLVVFATGRPPFMVEDLVERVGPAVSYGVMANGSVVCSFADDQVLRSVEFDLATALRAIEQLRGYDERYGFALATDVGFAFEPGFVERMPAATLGAPVADVVDAAAGATEALKLMVWHERHGAHELLALLPTLLDHSLAVTHMGADCVEVGPAGIDKAVALAWLCEHLGIDRADVVAFGDEYNDHEMLRWAGRSVAMANAGDVTKALCHEITVSNVDDGVAVAIERLLAER
jgi:Cof subfamily protein (haloacid dehalogenase superfamily)